MPSAIEPADVDVSLSEGVTIAWRDGHGSHFTVMELRKNCPCATCDDIRRHEPATAEPSVLPIYKPVASRLGRVQPVGRYAINFIFSDGHSTGIFTWEYLREICPCADCCRRRAAGRHFLPEPGGEDRAPLPPGAEPR